MKKYAEVALLQSDWLTLSYMTQYTAVTSIFSIQIVDVWNVGVSMAKPVAAGCGVISA